MGSSFTKKKAYNTLSVVPVMFYLKASEIQLLIGVFSFYSHLEFGIPSSFKK